MTAIVSVLPKTTINPSRIRQELTDKLLSFGLSLRTHIAYRIGVAGDGAGNLDVVDAVRRVYVQLGDDDTGASVEEAMWDLFKPAIGDRIFLARARMFGAGGWFIVAFLDGTDRPCLPAEQQ